MGAIPMATSTVAGRRFPEMPEWGVGPGRASAAGRVATLEPSTTLDRLCRLTGKD